MFKRIKKIFNYGNMLLYIMNSKQKLRWIFMFLLVVMCSLLQLVSIYSIAPLVSSVTNQEELSNYRIVILASYITGTSDFTSLFCALCIIIAIIYFTKEAFEILKAWANIKFAQSVQRELASEVLNSYMYREYDFFLGYGTTKVMRDVKEDSQAVNNVLTYIINLLSEFITVCMLMIYIVASDVLFALCLGGLAFISICVMFFGFKKTLYKAGNEARITSAENQKVLLEAVEGVKEVQVMKKQSFFVTNFNRSFVNAQKPVVFQYMAATVPTYVVEGIFVVGIMLYMWLMALYNPSFMNKLPLLASFLVAAIRLLPSIGRISNNMNNFQFCIPYLFSIYDNIRIIRELPVEKSSKVREGNQAVISFKHELELCDVSYRYKDAEKDVLKGLSITIHNGESVGIIGASGTGKSTLADIILGLHIPQKGQVRIDGIDIRTIPYEYSRVIGYVPQNVYLVDGTIRENVAFGVASNDIDDDAVLLALKKANLYDFVEKCDDGLNTLIGEKGVKFSGGQRQRLAIARALYRNPQILVLDEATSALDNETESAVMEQVEEMQGTITLIIIAHRLSTIEKCDSVYEIIEGKAVRKNGREKD